MLAVAVPAANASENWDKTSFDFGSRNVGTTSDPVTFTLVTQCDAGSGFPAFICLTPPGGVHNEGAPTVTGSGFAIVPDTDVCGARAGVLITPIFPSVDVCTTQVVFKPTSAGTKTGKLETPNGPDVALKGIGIGTGTTTTKKCKKKKKRSAAAAKKCKKRK